VKRNAVWLVQVKPKNEARDRHGEHIRQDIADTGIKAVSKVRYYPLFRIEGDILLHDIETIASRLLCDLVIECCVIKDACDSAPAAKAKPAPATRHEAEVWLKSGVTDAVASSVLKAIIDLGYNKRLAVKTGQLYVIEGTITKKTVEEIAMRLLINPLIQEYKLR